MLSPDADGQESRSFSPASDTTPPDTPRTLMFGGTSSPILTPGNGLLSSRRSSYFGQPHGHQASISTSASDASLPRVGSVSSSAGGNPFATPGGSTRRIIREAFASPPVRPITVFNPETMGGAAPRMESTAIDREKEIEKPWKTKEHRDPLIFWSNVITYLMVFAGIAGGALKIYFDYRTMARIRQPLCLVMDEDFSHGEEGIFGENGLFFREVDMSGFGNGEFEMTTGSSNNSFVRDGQLWITPTFSEDHVGHDVIFGNGIFNLTDCTYNITNGQSYTLSSSTESGNVTTGQADVKFDEISYLNACSGISNTTTGEIIRPIQSARISTRKTKSIRFGKVEVRAKIPRGDWIWPAIWMLPVDNVYGAWPLSGEIDIMESRGNNQKYKYQGANVVRGSLNWGPLTWLNSGWKTYGWWSQRRALYSDDFHTYTLEWTPDFFKIYVDTPLHHMLELDLRKSNFWQRGQYPTVYQNGSETVALENPWANGTRAAPFDQSFYLILSVAVGGTNGWFPQDSKTGKPWLDGSLTAARDFINSKDKWYPSWGSERDHSMIVDSVKMWQLC